MTETDDIRDRIAGLAQSHGFSPNTAHGMLDALRRGNGQQAQFRLPEAGGMGQWSSGGMLMIGDMFNSGLKARVQALIADLLPLVSLPEKDRQDCDGDDGEGDGGEWPRALGTPGSSGGQGDMRYAVFPDTRRLAIRQGNRLRVYDTGDHRIGGVSQQAGGGHGLTFSGQHGPVDLNSLPLVRGGTGKPEADKQARDSETPRTDTGSIPDKIEQLHGLFARGILTREEYEAKKADLLSRL